LSKLDIYVFLHHPGQYLDVNSKTKLPGVVGKLLFIDVVYEVSEDTLEKDAAIPCDRESDFSMDDCLETKVREVRIMASVSYKWGLPDSP